MRGNPTNPHALRKSWKPRRRCERVVLISPPIGGFTQHAIAKALILSLALAAEFYDALRDHFSGFERAIRKLKGRADILERSGHGLQPPRV